MSFRSIWKACSSNFKVRKAQKPFTSANLFWVLKGLLTFMFLSKEASHVRLFIPEFCKFYKFKIN